MNKTFLKRNDWIIYLLPSLILVFLFNMIPIMMAAYFSFTKYNVFQPPTWIGLNNFKRIFTDVFFRTSLRNTLVYTVVVVPVTLILSLAVSALLASYCRDKFGSGIRSFLFIPVISSMILVGAVWKYMFGTDGGIINMVLNFIGIPSVNWMGQRHSALFAICIVSIWKNVGYFLVIFYAGIMDIPISYYEAAEVDGATELQKFYKITLPILKPVTFLALTLCTIWSFQVFDLAYTMGGPGTSTITLVLTIYNAAFKEHSMGYACALSMLLFAIVMVISGIQKKLFGSDDDE